MQKYKLELRVKNILLYFSIIFSKRYEINYFKYFFSNKIKSSYFESK